ncbi:MAG: DivIVA domain-containing protein [Erysipelotrichaceae bacterium]|nr:DivIVA domain-containing protein [Erysipelotrichaceae bacterium]
MSELKGFDIVRNGYDPNQVIAELDRLQTQINTLNEKIVIYQSQIETLHGQFNTLRNRYQTLVSELGMREKAADDVARLALREANSVIENAQKNADDIIAEAVFKAQSMLEEVNIYNRETSKLKAELKEKLNEFVAILDKYDLPEQPDINSLVKQITEED